MLAVEQALGLVEDRRGDRCFGALGTCRSPSRRDEHDLVLGGVEADVGARDVVEDDEVGVLVVEHAPLALEAFLAELGAERDEHLAVALALAEERAMSAVGSSSSVQASSPFGRFVASAAAGR